MERWRDLGKASLGNDRWGKGRLRISNRSDEQNKYDVNQIGY